MQPAPMLCKLISDKHQAAAHNVRVHGERQEVAAALPQLVLGSPSVFGAGAAPCACIICRSPVQELQGSAVLAGGYVRREKQLT